MDTAQVPASQRVLDRMGAHESCARKRAQMLSDPEIGTGQGTATVGPIALTALLKVSRPMTSWASEKHIYTTGYTLARA